MLSIVNDVNLFDISFNLFTEKIGRRCMSVFDLIAYCKALYFRGGLIFAYFAENENSAKIKHAKI